MEVHVVDVHADGLADAQAEVAAHGEQRAVIVALSVDVLYDLGLYLFVLAWRDQVGSGVAALLVFTTAESDNFI